MTTDSSVLAASAELRAAFGSYRLVAEIGRGGMAKVFLALFPDGDGTTRQVVLKHLPSERARQQDFRAIFENEARLGTLFHHENVVETYGIHCDRDLCVLMMEFLDGQTLSRIRQRAGRGSGVPFTIHLRVLAEALRGLHYVHELTDEEGEPLGIVHRDVTPSNIFVTCDGHVKVVDFGIAQATARQTEALTGVVKGKLAYMSPEAVRGERVDRRSDIFSVGVMLWEAATGRRLWQDHDEVAVFSRLAAGDLPTEAPDAQGPSADMLRIANRALAVDPRERYATAEEMREELEEALARLGYTANETALSAYVEALFAAEREQLQAAVDEALASLPPLSVSQSHLLPSEESATYPDSDPAERATTSSYLLTSGNISGATTTWYDDIVDAASKMPNFRSGVRRASVVAVVAAAVAWSVAYAAHAPKGAPGPAPAVATAVVSPEPARESPAPVRGTIAAVFMARPARARLFLDGVPLNGNPAGIRRPPDDKPHLLRIEAPGDATLLRAIDLDRDIAKEFDLVPQAGQAVETLRTAPSSEPQDDPKLRPTKRAVAQEDPWGI